MLAVPSRSPSLKWLLMAVVVLILPALPLAAQQWTMLGPDGGDVRSLAYDPHRPDRVYLGTSTGQVFTSADDGRSWTRLAQFGTANDSVVDHIAVSP